MKQQRMFLLTVLATELHAPIEDIAGAIMQQALYADKVPYGEFPHFGQWPESKDLHWIGYRVTAAQFVEWGWLVMEYLHQVCRDGLETDGGHVPAGAMIPNLYVSDDGGKSFQDAETTRLSRLDPAKVN